MSAPEPALPKAIIFDLDGTLYDQRALRRAMLIRLARAYAVRPVLGIRTMRALSAYRSAQEELRERSPDDSASTNLGHEQLRLASQRTGYSETFVAGCVRRWMEEEPLDLVARHAYAGVREFAREARAQGLALGLLSDYPADAKLRALGLDDAFDAVLTAQSPTVGVFKPHPRGLRVVLELLETRPYEAVFVGDRVDVDAQAAAALDVPCYILNAPRQPTDADGWRSFASYAGLSTLLLRTAPASAPLNHTSTAGELGLRPGQPTI
jgi:HAD superfamily hydrolase (TIGR01509 family)